MRRLPHERHHVGVEQVVANGRAPAPTATSTVSVLSRRAPAAKCAWKIAPGTVAHRVQLERACRPGFDPTRPASNPANRNAPPGSPSSVSALDASRALSFMSPQAQAAAGRRDLLEQPVLRVAEAAANAEALLDDVERARLPHEVDGIDALVLPPRHGRLGVLRGRCARRTRPPWACIMTLGLRRSRPRSRGSRR